MTKKNLNSGGELSGTGVVVTHVNEGDKVYVRTHELWTDCNVLAIQLEDRLLSLEYV